APRWTARGRRNQGNTQGGNCVSLVETDRAGGRGRGRRSVTSSKPASFGGRNEIAKKLLTNSTYVVPSGRRLVRLGASYALAAWRPQAAAQAAYRLGRLF